MIRLILEAVKEWVEELLNGQLTLQNLKNELKSAFVLNVASLTRLQTLIPIIGIGNETKIYIRELKSNYILTTRQVTDTEDNCIFVSDTKKLVPIPNNDSSISITIFGGKSGLTTADNSSRLVKAIKYAMNNGLRLYVSRGQYYINEPIEITRSIIIEGESTLGTSGLAYASGACIIFTPSQSNKTLFTDNGAHNVTLKNINFYCPYTTFNGNYTENAETPHEYFTWQYEYDNVNCLDLQNSPLEIFNVGIIGFSGFGLRCKQNAEIKNVKVATCKYGFYNCKTDALFQDCFATRCEKAFYWDNSGSVIFVYNVWVDQCGYAFYSTRELSGIISGGEIDHCLYAGIYAKTVWSGLDVHCRMGRLGMYYLGTDVLDMVPTTYTDESFEEISKGVHIAVKNGKGLKFDISLVPRHSDDAGQSTSLLPTLFCFGNKWESAIIETVHDFGKYTYKVIDETNSNVNVINSTDPTDIDFSDIEGV